VLFERQFSVCPNDDEYWWYTSVAAFTSDGEPLTVSGRSWFLENGSNVSILSILSGVSTTTGKTLWNTTGSGGLYHDVVPSQTGDYVYVLFGPELRHINATDGSIRWRLRLPVSAEVLQGPSNIVVSPDGALAVITDPYYSIAIGVNLSKRAVMWKTDNSTLPLLLGRNVKPAFDAASGTVIIANVTSLLALHAASGEVAWQATFPDALDSNGFPGLAVDAAGGFAFFNAATQFGTVLVYAVDTTSGAVTGRYAFDADTYSVFDSVTVVDATGFRVYVSVRGPLLSGSATSPATAASPPTVRPRATDSGAEDRSSALQAVYYVALNWNEARTAVVNASIVEASTILQPGQSNSQMAVGPFAGQLTISTPFAVAVLQG